jgi:glycosyltransferase involved in cell wall biosynthesis
LNAFTRYLAQAFGFADDDVIVIELVPSDPDQLDADLRKLSGTIRNARVAVLAVHAPSNVLSHARSRLCTSVAQTGARLAFVGDLRADSEDNPGLIAVLHAPDIEPPTAPAPGDFRVMAVVPTYNEEDVIEQTLGYLIAEQVHVYVLDNWSTDRTVERATAFLGRGLIGVEQFPPAGPPATYDLDSIMRRVEQISEQASVIDWVILHDADERRRSPWPGVGLRDALWRVDRSGFSCVDHVTLNFWPVDDAFDPERDDMERYFRYFQFSNHPGHFHQRRAWRRSVGPVSLAPSAGHDVTFAGRRVYPYKFLLKHYPIRSQHHGERKVLRERVQRWNVQERARGWHRQYDDVRVDQFIKDPGALLRFEPEFESRYLLERLSGVGVFETPPAWATPPNW